MPSTALLLPAAAGALTRDTKHVASVLAAGAALSAADVRLLSSLVGSGMQVGSCWDSPRCCCGCCCCCCCCELLLWWWLEAAGAATVAAGQSTGCASWADVVGDADACASKLLLQLLLLLLRGWLAAAATSASLGCSGTAGARGGLGPSLERAAAVMLLLAALPSLSPAA